MTAREIVAQYLIEHGFDGLRNENRQCGCLVSDLGPSHECHVLNCIPGYRVDTPDDPEGFDYHIVENLGKWRAQKAWEKAEQEKKPGEGEGCVTK